MNSLKRLLAEEDTVIFVGSGISRWAGLTSWEGLIEALADYLESSGIDASLVRQEAKDGELLQAASYGVAKLTPPQFAAFIRDVSGGGSVAPVPIHEALMKLGPTCFITTNYDDLLEQSFRRWRNDPSEPRIVLNRHFIEQAEIVQTQARNFIFKSHGDARDSETVILTREQYRKLQPDGIFSATLKTLMTLLSTRPMLFVGFGLRDPDFLHVRDLLANIYRGGLRDHYAIVADPVPDQINWWRDEVGVHLVGYKTRVTKDGGRDHSGLLDLLTGARNQMPTSEMANQSFNILDAGDLLELARYAASNLTRSVESRFAIGVRRILSDTGGIYFKADRYEHLNAEQLLIGGPKRMLLVGAPGAGKSFAFRHAVNALATSLQDACIQASVTPDMQVPVLLDLKLYTGNLAQQLAERFPPNLTFAKLKEAFPIKLFLDGFNEMPRDHRESGIFDSDLDDFLAEHPQIEIIIGSRSTDGLDRLEFPSYELSEIIGDELKRLLKELNQEIPETHAKEISAILRRPFYFRLLERATISLTNIRSPADLYKQYISHLQSRFAAKFPDNFNLIEALERQAYRSLELGTEAFSLAELATVLRGSALQFDEARARSVLDWLVSEDFLIPLGGGRGAFVHQSVTEYLAACKLARHLLEDGEFLSELIAMRRWDNVIFLTISMLDGENAEGILRQIVTADLDFAIRAARFIEDDRESLIEALLCAMLAHPVAISTNPMTDAIGQLPFERSHEQTLRQIVEKQPYFRSRARTALARILGIEYKPELIELLINADNGSWLSEEMRALAPLIDTSDLRYLVDAALKWDATDLDNDEGNTARHINSLATAVGRFSSAVIEKEVFDRIANSKGYEKRILAELISRICWERSDQKSITMLMKLAHERLIHSTFAIYLSIEDNSAIKDYFIEHLDAPLLATIVDYVEAGDRWAVDLLSVTCAHSDEITESLLMIARDKTTELKQVLEYCATQSDEQVFAWLEHLIDEPRNITVPPAFRTLDLSELDWSDRNDLLVSLLALREPELTSLLLGGGIPVTIKGLTQVNLGDLLPWINWLVELVNAKDDESENQLKWLAAQLAFLIGHSTAQSSKDQLLTLLDTAAPDVREVIATMVLPNMDGLVLEDLAEDAIEFIMGLLPNTVHSAFRPHVFSLIATEEFVRDRLLPLAETENLLVWHNIETITDAVGRRLGLRFSLPSQPSNPNISPLH